jgi:iron-sulfur cluster assembly accessory protein
METATTATPAADASSPEPLRLTAAAVAQVKEVLKTQGLDGHLLAIRVVPAGCNGLGYHLDVVKEGKAGDLIWEQDGVKIATDPMSNKYLAGTEVDYAISVQGAGFKFQNPNAKSSCGCGTSFST